MIRISKKGPNDFYEKIEVAGVLRSYYLHVPLDDKYSNPAPLVVMLHGATGRGHRIARVSSFNDLSDSCGFLVVYPDSIGDYWNYNGTGHETVNDVAFIDTLIDECIKMFAIDHDRIYVAGVSNGGMMAFKLATILTDRIAAIASVAGLMTERSLINTTLSSPVSVILIHGTDDTIIPFNGGEAKGSLTGTIQPAPKVAEHWARMNGCSVSPESYEFPKKHPEDVTSVRRDVFTGSESGAVVDFYTIRRGGHTWPSGNGGSEELLSKTSHEINASEVIWEFFDHHPKIRLI